MGGLNFDWHLFLFPQRDLLSVLLFPSSSFPVPLPLSRIVLFPDLEPRFAYLLPLWW
jgi:hypothetical protein